MGGDEEWLVGLLYGNLLGRNADRAGYQCHLDELAGGTPLVSLIARFILSDEFAEKFVLNETPNELARKLITAFLGADAVNAAFIRTCAFLFVQEGLAVLVEALFADHRYMDFHGERGIPKYQ